MEKEFKLRIRWQVGKKSFHTQNCNSTAYPYSDSDSDSDVSII